MDLVIPYGNKKILKEKLNIKDNILKSDLFPLFTLVKSWTELSYK